MVQLEMTNVHRHALNNMGSSFGFIHTLSSTAKSNQQRGPALEFLRCSKSRSMCTLLDHLREAIRDCESSVDETLHAALKTGLCS